MNKIFTVIIVLLVATSVGCKNGLDYMIEEYNSRFGIHDDSILLKPGDDGYAPMNMILPEYHVDRDHTLNIPAPDIEGATYLWQIFKNGKEEKDFIKPKNGVTTSNFHLLENDLPVGTYTLWLTLTVGDKVLVDTAIVTVHDENSSYGSDTP